jgi:hypothetical protein
MLTGVDRIRRPASADGVLHFLPCVVVAADELEPIDDPDRVQLLPNVVPQLREIRQQGCDEIRVTEICDMSKLAAARASCIPEPG